jgi:hypothetical protein
MNVLKRIENVGWNNSLYFFSIDITDFNSLIKVIWLGKAENSMCDTLFRGKTGSNAELMVFARVLNFDNFLCLSV